MSTAAAPLAPETLARIADLELVARIIVEGLVSGLHRSPFHGYSAEFSQYRHYRPGDDLKYVDWKLAARTDRVYTMHFRETTNMTSALVVDASASMAFAGDAGVTKLQYAVMLSAALAYLVVMQGDAIGLMAEHDRRLTWIEPRSGRHHLRRVLSTLSSLQASAAWDAPRAIRMAADRVKGRGLLFVVSDFYDAEDATRAELRRAARMGHEVLLVQVMTRAELDFPYAGDVDVSDLETGAHLGVNAAAARRTYRDNVASFLERWRSGARGSGMEYALAITDAALDATLRRALLARGG